MFLPLRKTVALAPEHRAPQQEASDDVVHPHAHWWSVARGRILTRVLARWLPAGQREILEIGCGTGKNFSWLRTFGTIHAIEPGPLERVAAAKEDRNAIVLTGSLPNKVHTPSARYDLICLLDVLEHIREDSAALVTVSSLLSDGGKLLLTVPAYDWLWSDHDVESGHFRRYTMPVLLQRMRSAGLEIEYSSYFNTLLLPVLAVCRAVDAVFLTRLATGNEPPSALLNRALQWVFELEKLWIGRASSKCGASIVVVASRPRRNRSAF